YFSCTLCMAPSHCSTLSLHDALPILAIDQLAEVQYLVIPEKFDIARIGRGGHQGRMQIMKPMRAYNDPIARRRRGNTSPFGNAADRKSTRLNSSHVKISYAVFCLKKK